jgi:RHS repeat-associated protein
MRSWIAIVFALLMGFAGVTHGQQVIPKHPRPFLCTPPNCSYPPPTVSISPGTETVTNAVVAVTITMCDTLTLGNDTVYLNGGVITSQFTSTSGSSAGCFVKKTLTGNVNLNLGANTLRAVVSGTATNGNGLQQASASATYTYALPVYGATVTAAPQLFDTARAGQQYTTTFTVKNTGNVTDSLTWTASCSGPAIQTCGSVSPTGKTLTAGSSFNVNLTWTADTLLSATGSISLTANDGGSGSGVGTETVIEYATGLDVVDVNPGPSFSRGNCLAVAVAQDAAFQCGTLRIVHRLPSVRTYGKLHTPTLIYNARLASGTPNIGANLTVPGSMALDSVEGRLLVVEHGTSNTYPLAPELWHGSDWQTTGGQKTRRLQLTFFNSAFTPDLYDITFYTKRIQGTSVLVQDSAKAQEIIGNWYTSPFGMGWWLAGLERIQFSDSAIVWFGGDGSTQLYVPSGTNVWKPKPQTYVAGHDSVTYPFGSSHLFVRHAPHGVQVTFDSAGQQIQTIDRLGHATTFGYDSQGRLDTLFMAMPAPRSTVFYVFKYDANGVLDTVSAPSASGSSGPRRIVAFANSQHAPSASEAHDKIIDPDGFSDSLIYSSASGNQMLVVGLRDKRGTTTTFTYSGMPFDLAIATIGMQAGAGKDITHSFGPYNNFGQALPWISYASTQTANPDSIYYQINGPRWNAYLAGAARDSADTMRIFVDRWFEPTRIVDAKGSTTTIMRLNSTYPTLVTRSMDPLGRVETGVYDSHGNDSVVTDLGTYVSGQYAATRYQYDPLWDFATSVRLPAGELDSASFDPTTGNILWRQDGRGQVSRVTFGYDPSYSLVTTVTDARGNVDRLHYDSTLANLETRTTPVGFVTTIRTDPIGRDTLISSPVDSAQTLFSHVHKQYDHMDRDSVVFTYGPAVGPVAAESLTVRTLRDPEGAPLTVTRTETPDPGSIGTLTTTYHYDVAGRLLKSCPVDNTCDIDTLDAGGNIVSVTDRRGYQLHMIYDALNRVVSRATDSVVYQAYNSPYWVDSRNPPPGSEPLYGQDTSSFPRFFNRKNKTYVIPRDVATFAYDSAGHMTQAYNGDAQVQRSYNLNGTLATDTLRVRTQGEIEELGNPLVRIDTTVASNFTTHQYGLQYFYDIQLRRDSIQYPQTISYHDASGAAHAMVRYTYDPNTGALATVTDMFGNVTTYHDGVSDLLDTLSLPGQLSQWYKYDPDDRLIADSLKTSATLGTSPTVLHTTSLLRGTTIGYDARGKLLHASNTAPGTMMDAVTATYTGLGQIATTNYNGGSISALGVVTTFTNDQTSNVDALGNKITSHGSTNDANTYQSGFQSIWMPYMAISASTGTSFYDSLSYTANTGRLAAYYNEFLSATLTIQDHAYTYDANGNQQIVEATSSYYSRTPSVSFYGADEKLRAVDSRAVQEYDSPLGDTQPEWYRLAFEEYRYDALGRRVWVRSRKGCRGTFGDCYVPTERRVVWDGSTELAEISALGDDTVPVVNSSLSYFETTAKADPENDTPRPDSIAQNPHYVTPPAGNGTPPQSVPELDEFFGRVLYVDGRDPEHPVEIIRLDFSGLPPGCSRLLIDSLVFIPSYNYNGVADNGSLSSGAYSGGQNTACGGPVAAPWFGAYSQWQHVNPTFGWYGSLVQFKQDASGLTFARNRYYDGRTGRFTQEDPIGLAGGLNAYGFASGDPVNYSDPFGLCPPADKNYSTCAHGSLEWARGANRTQGNSVGKQAPPGVVAFSGATAAGFLGVGATASAGLFHSRYGNGPYLHVGSGPGLDIGAGGEGGASQNLDAFRGSSVGGCAGALSVGGCVSGNSSGGTLSGSETVGTRDLPIPVSVHAEPFSYTFAPTWGDIAQSFLNSMQTVGNAARGGVAPNTP